MVGCKTPTYRIETSFELCMVRRYQRVSCAKMGPQQDELFHFSCIMK